MMEGEERGSYADEILDDMLPEELDWRHLVRSYPLPVLFLSGVGGFFLGSRHGSEILSAMSSFVGGEIDRNISRFRGDG